MNRFSISVNDETLIEIEKLQQKLGSNRNAVIQLILNLGLLYNREKGFISTVTENDE